MTHQIIDEFVSQKGLDHVNPDLQYTLQISRDMSPSESFNVQESESSDEVV